MSFKHVHFIAAARARPQKTLDELYDAYEELLERKRQDERRYRLISD